MPTLHIGIDDTDSKEGMCTTYVGARIYIDLVNIGLRPIKRPQLIRLNPNCPYKTRGNAAIALRFEIGSRDLSTIKNRVVELVKSMSMLNSKDTEPGVAFYLGDSIPNILKEFSLEAVRRIVKLDEAYKVAREIGAEIYAIKGERGVIGALAAIGMYEIDRRTYELLAYRRRENWGTFRMIDKDSVIEMDRITSPWTFDNFDYESYEVRIAPHTPCPVLLGIRSIDSDIAFYAYSVLRIKEDVELTLLFETNQATDMHLEKKRICEISEDTSVIIEGRILDLPRTEKGGHVFFTLDDGTGTIQCAAFEPTKSFRKIIRSLRPGDLVRVYGGVKRKEGFPLTVNLEKIDIIELSRSYKVIPPLCSCGKRMKSVGHGKGYKCPSCGNRADRGEEILEDRSISPGSYEVPASARRHLTRPLSIERLVKAYNLIEKSA